VLSCVSHTHTYDEEGSVFVLLRGQRQKPDDNHLAREIIDPNFDRKLNLVTAGASSFLKEHLLTRITHEKRQNHSRLYLASSKRKSGLSTFQAKIYIIFNECLF
jgi:hypothetical protein